MIVQKPSIYVYVSDPDPICLRNVCAGIEEEGVLYQISMEQGTDLRRLAANAAESSVLGSGVAIVGSQVALQLRGCPWEKPVFWLTEATAEAARSVGADSARAIKKLPFKTQKD